MFDPAPPADWWRCVLQHPRGRAPGGEVPRPQRRGRGTPRSDSASLRAESAPPRGDEATPEGTSDRPTRSVLVAQPEDASPRCPHRTLPISWDTASRVDGARRQTPEPRRLAGGSPLALSPREIGRAHV